jgi:NTP pyrophosphatase (non-canonical NTP hydrolase)
LVDHDATPAWADYGLDQLVVEKWVRRSWGDKVFDSIEERVLRLAEEAIELAQAEAKNKPGMQAKLHKLIDSKFAKKTGDVMQELGGVGVCLLAYCAAKEVRLDTAVRREIDRVLGFDREHFVTRQQEKAEEGVTADDIITTE